jgi:hypothetical protein
MHGQLLVMHVPDPCIDNSGMSVRTRVQRTVRLPIISLEASSVRLVHPSSNALCRRLQTSRMKSVRFQHGRGYRAAQLARALATTRANGHGHKRTWHAGGGGSVMRLLRGRKLVACFAAVLARLTVTVSPTRIVMSIMSAARSSRMRPSTSAMLCRNRFFPSCPGA